MERAVPAPLNFWVELRPAEPPEFAELALPRCRGRPGRELFREFFEIDDARLSFSGNDSASPRHLMRTETLPLWGVNFRLLLTKLMIT
jgi:hypothetical protein